MIGAAIWSVTVAGGGFLFGQSLRPMLERIEGYEGLGALLIVGLAALLAAVRYVRSRKKWVRVSGKVLQRRRSVLRLSDDVGISLIVHRPLGDDKDTHHAAPPCHHHDNRSGTSLLLLSPLGDEQLAAAAAYAAPSHGANRQRDRVMRCEQAVVEGRRCRPV